MELSNDFTVNAPIDEAYTTLTDVERIAPCMPGAQLTEVEGDVYRGLVKVKVGPITAQFKGQASFVEKDEQAHRAVLKAEGRDTSGRGNASALITAQLERVEADVTKVTVVTDLTITGRVAQFGRGALADVSEKLLKQFVSNLETTVLTNGSGSTNGGDADSGAGATAGNGGEAGATATEAAASPTATASTATAADKGTAPQAATATPSAADSGPTTTGVRKIESEPVEPVDLLDAAAVPVAKRLLPLIGGVVLLFIAWRVLRRRR
jgi:carbon monoxide dehydrogenase subunit G